MILTEALYNVRHVWNNKDAAYDILNKSDMGGAVKGGKSVIVVKKGGHRKIFCYALQFEQWFKLLAKVIESPNDGSNESNRDLAKTITK